MSSSDLQTFAAIVGLLLTGFGLIFTGRQLRESKLIARGDFLLRLDDMLQQHNEVHTCLRPGGIWAESKHGPQSPEEWIAVERYMGLFERIKILIDNGSIDLPIVDRLYGYRVFNITANSVIRKAKLEDEAASWSDFIDLWLALQRRRQEHEK